MKRGDRIIQLGDIADGWHEVAECVEFLLEKQKDYEIIFIKGNHDQWFQEWLTKGDHPDKWIQGGEGTLKSYCNFTGNKYSGDKVYGFRTNMSILDIPKSHLEMWKNQKKYFIDENFNIFVHGGFNRHFLLSEQTPYIFWWDRDLWNSALSYESMTRGALEEKPQFKIKEYCNEIFIGHTSTEFWQKQEFMKAANIYNVDCGAGYFGKLCMLCVNTKEAYYSDNGNELYPGMKGR